MGWQRPSEGFQTAYKFVGQIFVFDIYHFIKITLLPLQSLLSHVV